MNDEERGKNECFDYPLLSSTNFIINEGGLLIDVTRKSVDLPLTPR